MVKTDYRDKTRISSETLDTMQKTVSEKETIDEILKRTITETEKFCGLTITDSLGVNVSSGLIQYMKQGFVIWLKQQEQEMFINTVSSMDCELSAIRTETFEELIKRLQK